MKQRRQSTGKEQSMEMRGKGPLKERLRMLMQLKEMTTKRGEGESHSIYTAM